VDSLSGLILTNYSLLSYIHFIPKHAFFILHERPERKWDAIH